MSNYAIIKDGWVDGIVMAECGFNPGDYNVTNHVELTWDETNKIMESQLTMFHDGEKFCQIKDPKVIWKRLRGVGFQGKYCLHAHKKHLEQIDNTYPDISVELIINGTQKVKNTYEPLFETEFLPDLKISLATEDDVDIWETAMIKSGLFTEEEAWTKAAEWLSDPKIWCIKTIWKDRILQIETYHFNEDGTVFAGFTSHIDRTRPLWFWRQMAKPVFDALYAHGFEVIKTSVRKDRRDWVDSLKEIYGAKELRETDQGVILRYKIEDTLALIGKWPTRRTLSLLADKWEFEKDGVLVREAVEADFPAIRQAMDISWGNSKRKDLALTMFEDRWTLDMAAILLAFVDGDIIDGATFRERQDPTISSFTSLFKKEEDKKEFNTAFEGFGEWQKGVGYKEMSFVIETTLHEGNPKYEANVQARGWKIYKKENGLTEWRMGLGT